MLFSKKIENDALADEKKARIRLPTLTLLQ